ncbi:MAG: LysM peptidoglycan-binding domain-containing M23 family metallopeptidase, partial [Anaerolinea sp.]|nr:LysM peptidoglycan-binding domain-containing M23 family metallopeptidase [Anaerolinea sp.]
ALALTVATVIIALLPVEDSRVPAPAPALPGSTAEPGLETGAPTEVAAPPTSPAPIQIAETTEGAFSVQMLPTLAPEAAAALLNTPVQIDDRGQTLLVRDIYQPFTIIPDRPRSGVEQYEVVAGDTIFSIAERFGLKPESIAWSNDRSIIGGLRPGRIINIPPVDGALYTVPAQETIQQIADRFRVDPYVIIDSEFNDFFGMTPDTLLPSGTLVVVPGGEAEQISWNPVVERVEGPAGRPGSISFSPGDPGSCGLVENPGGSGGWSNPLSGSAYQWTRGFTSFHTGVDLAAPPGTPVKAAQGGAVIFAGWNSFGYGYAIVLAHGPFTTVYGHLSAINVGCRQIVSPGQVIGAVGSTGQSSGPHLHFEIRYNDVPQDPTTIMPF